MKKMLILSMSVVMVVMLFPFIAVAFPPLPEDLNIVQPDPALPKELAAFSGKWAGKVGSREFYLVVEKIDQEKASLRIYGTGWDTVPGEVVKEYGKWKIFFQGRYSNQLSLRGKYLDWYVVGGAVSPTLTKVP